MRLHNFYFLCAQPFIAVGFVTHSGWMLLWSTIWVALGFLTLYMCPKAKA